MTRVAPKKPGLRPPRPDQQESNEFEGVESNENDVGARVEILGLNRTAYKRIDI